MPMVGLWTPKPDDVDPGHRTNKWLHRVVQVYPQYSNDVDIPFFPEESYRSVTLDSLLEGELARVPEGIAPLVQVLYEEARRCLNEVAGGKKISRRLTRPQLVEAELLLTQIQAQPLGELDHLIGKYNQTVYLAAAQPLTAATIPEHWEYLQASSPAALYSALDCVITPVNEGEWTNLNKLCGSLLLKGVYRLGRPFDHTCYTGAGIGNERLLFHGTRPGYLAGILSRGLLLPAAHSSPRTDYGLLGPGLYFTDDPQVAAQYAPPTADGFRYLLVCQVACGTSYEVPVLSFQGASELPDSEFVIYDRNQQYLQYLVKFQTENDEPAEATTAFRVKDKKHKTRPVCQTALNMSETEKEPEISGLLDNSGRLLPLQQVSIKAKILDNVSEVHIFQEYWNPHDQPIEAKFVFPLDARSAVCGFEAFVDGRHIIGKVEEKQKAHKKYEEAISRGDGAFLMDQSDDNPDVFTVSVGNLLPYTTAIIQITYISELEVDNQSILFRLPASLAPESAMKAFELTQTQVQSVSAGKEPARLSVEIGISSPSIIAQIDSSSHAIDIKRTSSVATVRLPQPVRLITDFLLHIDIPKAHTPRLWLEEAPEGGYAAMLTLYPEITQSSIERTSPLVILLLDRSYSLASASSSITRLALAFLESIDRKECRLNVVAFGSGAVPAFSSPLEMDEDIPLPPTVAEFVRGSEVDMGSTNLLHALQLISRLVPETESTINVVLLSDGLYRAQDDLVRLLADQPRLRLFPFGIGEGLDRHCLRVLARSSGGLADFAGAHPLPKIRRLARRVFAPAMQNVDISWSGEAEQAPRLVPSLLSDERTIIYAFLPAAVRSVTISSRSPNETFVVRSSGMETRKGRLVHRLAARRAIEDWDAGLMAANSIADELLKTALASTIVDISIRHSVLCRLTSFIAFEDRSTGSGAPVQPFSEIVARFPVDELRHMEFQRRAAAAAAGEVNLFTYIVLREEEHEPRPDPDETPPSGPTCLLKDFCQAVARVGPPQPDHAGSYDFSPNSSDWSGPERPPDAALFIGPRGDWKRIYRRLGPARPGTGRFLKTIDERVRLEFARYIPAGRDQWPEQAKTAAANWTNLSHYYTARADFLADLHRLCEILRVMAPTSVMHLSTASVLAQVQARPGDFFKQINTSTGFYQELTDYPPTPLQSLCLRFSRQRVSYLFTSNVVDLEAAHASLHLVCSESRIPYSERLAGTVLSEAALVDVIEALRHRHGYRGGHDALASIGRNYRASSSSGAGGGRRGKKNRHVSSNGARGRSKRKMSKGIERIDPDLRSSRRADLSEYDTTHIALAFRDEPTGKKSKPAKYGMKKKESAHGTKDMKKAKHDRSRSETKVNEKRAEPPASRGSRLPPLPAPASVAPAPAFVKPSRTQAERRSSKKDQNKDKLNRVAWSSDVEPHMTAAGPASRRNFAFEYIPTVFDKYPPLTRSYTAQVDISAMEAEMAAQGRYRSYENYGSKPKKAGGGVGCLAWRCILCIVLVLLALVLGLGLGLGLRDNGSDTNSSSS